MRKFIVVIFVLAAVFALPALAEDWTKNYTVGAKPALHVDTNDASIEIARGSANTIAARIVTDSYKIGVGGVGVTEHQDGDKVELTVRVPGQKGIHVNWHDRRVRVVIQVPAETALDLRSGDGSIGIDGTSGDARIDTDDGAVEVRNFSGGIRARTADGHITLDGVLNEVYLNSGDGHISLTARPGSKMDRAWLVRTSDGPIEVRLPADFAAEIYANTGDGRITLDVPLTVSGSVEPSRLRGKLNGGGELLEISTGDGRIQIGKL